MSQAQDPVSVYAGRRTIYRGVEPQRKPLIWLAFGLVGVCVIGLLMRGPEPFILAALVLSPVAVFGYYLFVVWGQKRVRRVELEAADLIIREGFGKERRLALSGLEGWAMEDVALYTAGVSYDSNQSVQIDTGAEITGPALTAREKATGNRIELVVEGAEINVEAIRAFAPTAIAELEKRSNRKGKAGVSFKSMSGGR